MYYLLCPLIIIYYNKGKRQEVDRRGNVHVKIQEMGS